MASRSTTIAIHRHLGGRPLASPPASEALDQAEEEGALLGNRAYFDLRGMDWSDVRDTLAVELPLLVRLEAAADLDEEWEEITEELCWEFGVEALWSLDVGVASAAIALSVLGATPIASCNGGVLGGRHLESYPLIAFYLPPQLASCIQALAQASGAGLLVDAQGVVQLYGSSYRELVTFAELALEQYGQTPPT